MSQGRNSCTLCGMNPSPSSNQPGANKRAVSIVVFWAMFASTLMYIGVCYLMAAERSGQYYVPRVPTPTSRLVIPIISGLALIASVLWFKMRTAGRSGDTPKVIGMSTDLMTPAAFHAEMVTAMSIGQMCAIFGLVLFFMGGSAAGYLPYAAGSALVDLLVILPTSLRYWTAFERRQPASEGPFGGPEE